MKSALVLALVLFAAICSAKISPAVIEDVPSLVQVESGYSIAWLTTCAGTVLTNVHVLSAARCFKGILARPSTRRIRAGATKRLRGGTILNIQSFNNHPDADVSVVRLLTPFTYGPTIQPAAIVAQGTVIPASLAVTTAGWGFIEQDGWRPIFGLRSVDLVTISNEACEARYEEHLLPFEKRINPDHLCSGLVDEGGLRIDVTDAGAPFYYQNVVVGIQSFGSALSNNYPLVSTRVSDHTQWIVDNAV